MGAKKSGITDLSDSEFLSFLYSERDRENSLSQYQGWNYWALVGAIGTIQKFTFNQTIPCMFEKIHYICH